MLSAGAYAPAKCEPGFAAAWDAALTARHDDRRPTAAKLIDALSNAELMRRLRTCEAKLEARPRGRRRATKQALGAELSRLRHRRF